MIEDRNQRSSILYLPFYILHPHFCALFHLSFCAQTITAQMKPMIQKRTMICGSFQPLSS
jgi:hypothetical protein